MTGGKNRKDWSHIHRWQLKIGKDIFGMDVTPEDKRVSAPHQALQTGLLVLEREVPITYAYENQQRLWLNETRAAGVPGVLFTDNSLTLTSSRGTVALTVPGIYGKKLNCLALGKAWKGSFLSFLSERSAHTSFLC